MQEAEFQQFEKLFFIQLFYLIVFDNKVPENVSFIIQKHC